MRLPEAVDAYYPERPWTVCFYSFRGGVWRTTLAVNTAIILSHGDAAFYEASFLPDDRGLLLLDMDLEAPGVDCFERLKPASPKNAGLVEYVRHYLETGVAAHLREYVYGVGAPRQEYPVIEGGWKLLEHGVPTPYQKLYVMRAGRLDSEHRRFLTYTNWDRFYRENEGHRFFENLRAGVAADLMCDLLIVDSRTGLTEVGSICTGHLADACVLVFEPTTAHVGGLRVVARALRERERREERQIPRLYVASKIHERSEDKPDEEQMTFAKSVVRECEDIHEVIVGPDDVYDSMEVEGVSRNLDWKAPMLGYLFNRPGVPDICAPDGYLVAPAQFPPSNHRLFDHYRFVATWITNSFRAVVGPTPRDSRDCQLRPPDGP